MATGLITKRAVDGFAAADCAASFLWDTEVKGFGLKATRGGTRTYVYQYRVGGRETKVRRVTIGAHGPWTPDGARREARRLAQLVDQGTDPAAAAVLRKREMIELAFPAYAERFIIEYLQREWTGGHELASGLLRRDIIPFLRRKSLRDVTRADVSALLDKLSDRPATRRNAFAVLRRLLRWAVNRGDLESSVLNNMDAPPAPASRDRVLSDTELAHVWVATARLGYPFGPMVRLLLLTGQRREEVAGLSWNELNRKQALWTIPARRAKNGVVHDVPLSRLALAVIDDLAQRASEVTDATSWPVSGLVFTTNGTKSVSGYSAAKRRLDRFMSELEPAPNGEPWRFHDLRRSLATGLQRLGVRFEVTEAVLNHISGSRSGVAGVYQRHNWSDEKREALEQWSARLEALSAPTSISDSSASN